MIVLSYLDFFSTGVQRVALATATNMCKKLPLDVADFVMEAVPLLTNLLQYHDAQKKSPGESLTWEDLGKIKYTWRVAMETLRIFPPIFGGVRQTVKGTKYERYLIPKGWKAQMHGLLVTLSSPNYQQQT
ncbi:taxadiene 5-alpha hydroxylase isoform X2 [Capsicum annuum]|uniref:taxadiene 5-alpha hydroxylase isoform X2 n=1 Tax=Capsicum annuum TaxID=4072 RepID=UPI0007BF3C46|nr:taxadiene 5-alpha hydroxylase isoform X2 [Capsicum annuum]XP_047252856.1 taxadiene 5-alpha hydroxylase isoform X2 [Capsicum annuum]XP_047252857.1 taxadiene 5-alpha hydroxylase isoform X2 [Capsicum annuum]XP_047252858.1 taxadiene 5-alpha hydroxylase isoform X2 [Capsicum annuum]